MKEIKELPMKALPVSLPEVSRLFIINGFIIFVEEFCIISYPPNAHGFATLTQLGLLNLHKQGQVHC